MMAQTPPDVLLAVGKQGVWLSAVLSVLTGVPMVAVGAGSEFTERSRLGRLLNRWSFGRARHRIVISEYTRQLMISAGISSARISETTLVPCGADDRRYQPGLDSEKLRERLGLDDRCVLLTVGQLSERKAQDVVIRALPAIIREYPGLVYVMVGIPTRGPELVRLAEELGVRDHVRLAGVVSVEELPLYYNLADLFVLVSRRAQDGNVEGYGIVVAEAALCGLPAVVSKGCGLEEAVVEGRTGLLVEPDDPQATASAILRLLADAPLRQEMGAAARDCVSEMGTWAQRIAVYDRILIGVVGGQ